MITERVGSYAGNGAVQHLSAQIIKSADHGQSWSNFLNPYSYNVNGSITYPAECNHVWVSDIIRGLGFCNLRRG